jgi:hypothetical protein
MERASLGDRWAFRAPARSSGRLSKRRAGFAALTVFFMIAVSAVAFADNIINSLDASVDAVAEIMPLNAGSTGTTTLYLTPENGDGKNGCNLTGSTTLGLSVSSSNTSVATVSPSSVTFGSCGDVKTLTVNALAIGSSSITVAQTSNNTGGSFDLAPATFTVNVSAAPPANTAPSVSVSGVTGGDSYNKGSVPSATCLVTDAEDGNSSFPATLSSITGPYASDGIGSQTASCSYTDGGGLTASASETYSIVDPSAPSIGYTLNPATATGSNDWYTGNVSLTWSVTEAESPNSLAKTGCVNQSITSDQTATDYSCSATSAGGSAGPVTVTIKRDGTAPTITDMGFVSGTAGTNGWYKSAVTNGFSAIDTTSELFDCDATFSKTSSTTEEGSAVTISSGTCSDNAGNTATAINSAAYMIDLSDPTNVQFVGGPAEGSSHYFGSVPAAPTCTADDAISGFASCIVTGYSTAVGTHTMTATASDNASRTATATRTYHVLAWTLNGFFSPVDMNGVWNTVKGGSTVPLKFEVFIGATEQTSVAVVDTFTVKGVACPSGGVAVDDIELVTTGGTSLRYDSTAGQFIQNWQTPKKPGACFTVTMKTDDASTISANFMLK